MASALAYMTHKYSGNIIPDSSSGFESGRIIVKSRDKLPDISTFNPVLTVIDDEEHYFIQFSSAAEARACAQFLNTHPTVEYAEADSQMFLDSE